MGALGQALLGGVPPAAPAAGLWHRYLLGRGYAGLDALSGRSAGQRKRRRQPQPGCSSSRVTVAALR